MFFLKDGFLDLQLLEQRSEIIKQDVLYDIYIYELRTTRGTKRIVTGPFSLFLTLLHGECDRSDD